MASDAGYLASPLRPYQVRAVEATLAEWDRGVRSTLLVSAVGSGKTRAASEIVARRAPHGPVLWLAHRLELLDQAADAIRRNTGLRVGLEQAEKRAKVRGLFGASDDVVVASIQTMNGARLQKFFRPDDFATIVIDECFPAGTMVDGRPIESIRAGDVVTSWDENANRFVKSRVMAQWSSTPHEIACVRIGGSVVYCTPGHMFLTRNGWVPAALLMPGEEVLRDVQENEMRRVLGGNRSSETHFAGSLVRSVQGSAPDTKARVACIPWRMPCLRRCHPYDRQEGSGSPLQGSRVLLSRVLKAILRGDERAHYGGHEPQVRIGEDEGQESDACQGDTRCSQRCTGRNGPQTTDTGRERPWSYRAAADVAKSAWRRLAFGVCGKDEDRNSAIPLQDRYCTSGENGCDRSGRRIAQCSFGSGSGRKESSVSSWARVDGVSRVEPTSDGTFGGVCPDGLVYNIEVEETHTYTVDGMVVHNCHHSPAKSFRKLLDYFAHAKVVGITATPDRGDKVGLHNVFESSPFRYSIADAINDGYLCDVRSSEIVIPGLDIGAVRTTCGELNAGDLADLIDRDAHLHSIAHPLVRESGSRPTVVFMPSVDSSRRLAEIMRSHTDAGVRWISGETAKEERARILAEYQSGSVQYLINCALLTEGWDAPHTACVGIVRPTKSRALYEQMIGRGTRLSPSKTGLLVLDFVPQQAGRHRLVCPADVLAGKDVDDEILSIARTIRAARPAMPEREVLEAAERERADRQRRASEAEDRRRAKAAAAVQYRTRTWDPFGIVSDADLAGSPMTAATQRQLDQYGLRYDDSTTEEAARRLLNNRIYRIKAGLCSQKQAMVLAARGLRTDVTFAQAKTIIDAIMANGPRGWRNPTPDRIKTQYRRA